jgi:hypothetical protein
MSPYIALILPPVHEPKFEFLVFPCHDSPPPGPVQPEEPEFTVQPEEPEFTLLSDVVFLSVSTIGVTDFMRISPSKNLSVTQRHVLLSK